MTIKFHNLNYEKCSINMPDFTIIYRQNPIWQRSNVTGVTIHYTVVFHPGE
jgi:hypothetical protein